MDWTQIISLALNLVLGGGFFAQFINMRSQKRKGEAEADKAKAEVKTTELDNVQEAIKIWRDMAESLSLELKESRTSSSEIATQVEALRKEVARLTVINSKILKLLDKITGDNFETIVEQIKKEINENNG